jgi:N-ethylmaleimide reductase
VELHGANGYLINQFIDSAGQHRTDAYGGTLPTGCASREVAEAVAAEVGPQRIGVRLAPLTTCRAPSTTRPKPPIWPRPSCWTTSVWATSTSPRPIGTTRR